MFDKVVVEEEKKILGVSQEGGGETGERPALGGHETTPHVVFMKRFRIAELLQKLAVLPKIDAPRCVSTIYRLMDRSFHDGFESFSFPRCVVPHSGILLISRNDIEVKRSARKMASTLTGFKLAVFSEAVHRGHHIDKVTGLSQGQLSDSVHDILSGALNTLRRRSMCLAS